MIICLASDHAGFDLKNHLAEFIGNLGYTVVDKGPFSLDPADDYPDLMRPVAQEILKDPAHIRGIIMGGSGEGEAICVNRMKGIRAAVYYGGTLDVVKITREHNDSNILSLGARFITREEAEAAVRVWLETKFSGDERHKRRIAKIDG